MLQKPFRRVNKDQLVEKLNQILPQYIYSPEEMVEIFNYTEESVTFSFINKKANFLDEEINALLQQKRFSMKCKPL